MYTPTDEEVREAIAEWAWSRRMFRPELGQSDGAEGARWLAAHDAALRAEWEAECEHVFIERYGAHHAKFGGIGGDATSLTITREAWKSVGEPDVLAVSRVPVEQGDGS